MVATRDDDWPYTSGELAAMLGVTPRTVARWCREGAILDVYQTAAGRWRIARPVRLDGSLGRHQRTLELLGRP